MTGYVLNLGDGWTASVHGSPDPSPESAAAIEAVCHAAVECVLDDAVLVGLLPDTPDPDVRARDWFPAINRLIARGLVARRLDGRTIFGFTPELTPEGEAYAAELRAARAVA